LVSRRALGASADSLSRAPAARTDMPHATTTLRALVALLCCGAAEARDATARPFPLRRESQARDARLVPDV